MQLFSQSKSYIAALLLLTILGGEVALGLIIPKRAYAQTPTGLPVFLTGGKLDVSVLDVTAKTKENILNVIAKNTVMAVQAIFLRSLADWVRSGMNGKPQFITNPEQYFKQLAGAAILNTQIQLLSTRMCRPFGNGPSGGVTINTPSIGGYPELNCTLTNSNIQGFYDKFENGGWQTWREVSQPQNNDIGMLMLVSDAASREVANNYAHGNREILSSQGFLGIKNCAVTAAFATVVSGKQFNSSQCAQYSNVTPGGIVAAKVSETLLQDVKTWVNVHELSDLIAAFINTALNKLIGTRFFCLDCANGAARAGLTVGLGGALQLACDAYQNNGQVSWVEAGSTLQFIATANTKQTTPPLTFTFSNSPLSPNLLTAPQTFTVNGAFRDINIPTQASDAGKTLVINVSAQDSSKPAQAGTAQCTVQVKGAATCASLGCTASQYMCAASKGCYSTSSQCGQFCGGAANCTPC